MHIVYSDSQDTISVCRYNNSKANKQNNLLDEMD